MFKIWNRNARANNISIINSNIMKIQYFTIIHTFETCRVSSIFIFKLKF